MTKKICVVHNRAEWLAITEYWLYNQVKYLDECIEPVVVCRNRVNRDQFSVRDIYQLEFPFYYNTYCDKVLRRLRLRKGTLHQMLTRLGPDIVHSHFGPDAYHNLREIRQANVRHVVSFYGFDATKLPKTEPIWQRRYRKLFKHTVLVLCEGSFMAQTIRDLGCSDDKLHVHHLGVALEELPYQPRSWNPGSPLKVLLAASFTEKKGLPYALEALAQLQPVVPVEITLIGDAKPNDAESQHEKAKILTTIDRRGVAPYIRLLGFQPHDVLLNEAYQHHIFLSPSVTAHTGDAEGGCPVVLIEMAATGMPIVSTKHCDIPEVLHGGKNGLLADERDVQGLVMHLRWLCEHPERWQPLVEGARQHIEQQYNAEIQGKRLSQIYRNMLEE